MLIGSTLVEGSTLSESEAKQVLAGRTLVGHPVHEIREITNYRSAVEFLMKELKKSAFVSANLVQDFHRRLFVGSPGVHGKWKSHSNFIYRSDGTKHTFSHPSLVQQEMSAWLKDFNSSLKTNPKDVPSRAAQLYYRFVQIHPFDDGNGRIARILIAYWVYWKGRMDFSFYAKDRLDHLRALEASNEGDFELLVAFFKKRIKKARSK